MEDDDLQLSASTLSALQEFMQEKDAREKRFEELKAQAEEEKRERDKLSTTVVTMEDFEADWQVSQFWYDDETSQALAEELVAGAGEDTNVVLVSAPR
ncbi:hypothetical protein H072_1391 [Dactylellina haptotyla CBS 200.50]|uniref:Uncharacterized protein n=1 Tax=Dactylellina haptotyla (strain CBS 200.50) TaxID=1284197 RepID=S8ANT1_DACHA|nr:hypothetical protein H072_1391 [Dactylellina haptotyla CBS 200.50]